MKDIFIPSQYKHSLVKECIIKQKLYINLYLLTPPNNTAKNSPNKLFINKYFMTNMNYWTFLTANF